MSNALECNLIQHLFDLDSLEWLAREGFDPEILPTQELRLVYNYALEYFFESRRVNPLSVLALQTYEISVGVTMADVLDDLEIPYEEEPELSIADVVSKLRSNYAHLKVSTFNREFATAMADADQNERVAVAAAGATQLIQLVNTLETRRNRVDARNSIDERLIAFEQRVEEKDNVDGMSFGLSQIDNHTLFIHPGELAVLAAYAKVGKSYWMIMTALNEWRRGRVVSLFSLENSIDMTLDRLCCVATSVDATHWARGECNSDEVDRVRDFKKELEKSDNSLYILQPPSGARTAEAMVRQAQVLETDSLLIDQLTFMEHPQPRSKPRHEVVRDIMHSLKVCISATNDPIATLLAHQINREGKKTADKIGYHMMDHLAESSEVERTADMVFSLYQSQEAFKNDMALFQILAGRRFAIKWWDLFWSIGIGVGRVRNEVPVYG